MSLYLQPSSSSSDTREGHDDRHEDDDYQTTRLPFLLSEKYAMQVFELFLGHILLAHGSPHCKGHKSKPVKSRTRSIFSAMSKLCRAEKHRHTDSSPAQSWSERGKNSCHAGGTQPSARRHDPQPLLSPILECSACPEPKGLCPQAASASINLRRSSPDSHRRSRFHCDERAQ